MYLKPSVLGCRIALGLYRGYRGAAQAGEGLHNYAVSFHYVRCTCIRLCIFWTGRLRCMANTAGSGARSADIARPGSLCKLAK